MRYGPLELAHSLRHTLYGAGNGCQGFTKVDAQRKSNVATARFVEIIDELADTYTQREIAERLNISESHLSRIKSGATVSLKVLRMLQREFGVKRDWMRSGIGSMFVERTAESGGQYAGEREAMTPLVRFFCRACAREIGPAATECPHCQAPIKWTELLMQVISGG